MRIFKLYLIVRNRRIQTTIKQSSDVSCAQQKIKCQNFKSCVALSRTRVVLRATSLFRGQRPPAVVRCLRRQCALWPTCESGLRGRRSIYRHVIRILPLLISLSAYCCSCNVAECLTAGCQLSGDIGNEKSQLLPFNRS